MYFITLEHTLKLSSISTRGITRERLLGLAALRIDAMPQLEPERTRVMWWYPIQPKNEKETL